MTKLFFTLLFVVSLPLFAQDDEMELSPDEGLETETQPDLVVDQASPEITPVMNSIDQIKRDTKKFNPFSGHWLFSLGGESSTYDVPWDFDGVQTDFKASTQYVAGARASLGREFHLGKGLFTTTKVEGFYHGTLFTKAKNAGPEDESIEFASFKKKASIWGLEAAQSLGFIFEWKTKNPVMGDYSYLTFEPYVEAGLGRVWAYNSIEYKYEINTQEFYRQRIADDIVNARFGAGFNITSSQGYFLYVKVTQNNFDIMERKTRGRKEFTNGSGVERLNNIDKKVDIDPTVVYALGGGYKF
jgi:hypothetical protein